MKIKNETATKIKSTDIVFLSLVCTFVVKMVYKKFVELGRVVFISQGPHQRKIAAIIDVLDQNRLLIAGPVTNVGLPGHVINIKHTQLTKFYGKVNSRCKDVIRCVKKWWKKMISIKKGRNQLGLKT